MTTMFNDYINVDQGNAINKDKELITQLNIDAAGVIPVAPGLTNNNTTYNTAFPGYTYDDIASIEQNFENMDNKYFDMLQKITEKNKLSSMTEYMGNVYENENTRLTSLKKQSVNNVHKLRQQFMANKYAYNYQKYLTNILFFTLVVAIICCVAMATVKLEKYNIDMTTAYVIVAFVLILYVLALFIYYKNWQSRRKDDWNKFYFANPQNKKTQ
jgi:hypothetical protein